MTDPTRSRAAMCPCCAAGGCPSCRAGHHAGERSHDFVGPGHTVRRHPLAVADARPTRSRAADVIGDFLMDWDIGLPGNEARERAEDLMFELHSQGYDIVPIGWAKEASANDNA